MAEPERAGRTGGDRARGRPPAATARTEAAPPGHPAARVAVVGPFSGPRAAWGELLREAAAATYRARVSWEFHDDRGDAATAREVGRRVALDPGVVAVVGHFNSLGARESLPRYREAGVPVLLPLSTLPGLLDTAEGWALRWCPDDTGQLAALWAAVAGDGHPALDVTDDGSDYGRRLARAMTGRAAAGPVVRRANSPGAGHTPLLVCGTHAGAARTARRFVAAGRTGPLLFPDDCAVGEFAELLGAPAGRARVARLTGGPRSLVEDAVRALDAALAAQPGARGRELLSAVRAHTARRFTAAGDPLDPGPDGGWEVVPVAALASGAVGDGRHRRGGTGVGGDDPPDAAPPPRRPPPQAAPPTVRPPSPTPPAPPAPPAGTPPAGPSAPLASTPPDGPAPARTPPPVTAAPATAPPVTPPRVMPAPLPGAGAPRRTHDLDAVVVGCGAVGSAVAALLAEAGVAVGTTEPEAGGPSATRYSGGLVRAYEPDRAMRALAVRSHGLLWGREGDERREAGFRRTGSLVLLGPDDLPQAREGVAELLAGGVPARLLTPAQLRSRHPEMHAPGLAGAVWEPDGGYADPRAFAAARRRSALRRGAVVLPGGAVLDIVPGPSGVVVRTAAGAVTAAAVVLAAGGGTPALLPAGHRLGAGGLRTKVVRYAFFDRAGRTLPTVSDLVTGVWGRPQLDGEFGAGFLAGRPVDEWDAVPHGADTLAEREYAYIRAGASERWPWLTTAPVLGGRCGVDLYAAGGPLLGPLRRAPRLVLAAGWSGAGFKTAPAAAEHAAGAVLRLLGGAAA